MRQLPPPEKAFLEHAGAKLFRVVVKQFDAARGEVVKVAISKKPLPRDKAVAVKATHNWPGLERG